MPGKEQIDALVAQGVDYPEIGRRLGIPAGQAFLIHTGMPADAARPTDEPTDRPDVPTGRGDEIGADEHTRADPHSGPVSSSPQQHLANPPHENPTSRETVHDWIARRVAADEQMRRAGAAGEEGHD